MCVVMNPSYIGTAPVHQLASVSAVPGGTGHYTDTKDMYYMATATERLGEWVDDRLQELCVTILYNHPICSAAFEYGAW